MVSFQRIIFTSYEFNYLENRLISPLRIVKFFEAMEILEVKGFMHSKIVILSRYF